jgi:glutamyl-tRNA reductase
MSNLNKVESIESYTIHPPGRCSVNQELLSSQGMLTLDRGPQVEATIASLKQHFEAVRQREVKRMHGRLGALSSAQENAIESLTHSIVARILDIPINVLETIPEKNDRIIVIKTVHRIFSLGKESKRCSL